MLIFNLPAPTTGPGAVVVVVLIVFFPSSFFRFDHGGIVSMLNSICFIRDWV